MTSDELLALETVDADPLWCLVLEGFDPDVERIRAAIASLADGRVGIGGATLAGHANERRWVLASGVYEGDGAETHLLPAPVGFHLPYRIEPGAPLRRVVDLRTGVLWEHAEFDAGPVRSVRFASLARPGVMVMRAACPDSRAAPLLQPSSNGEVTAQGSDGDVIWMCAGTTSDGNRAIAAAAHESRVMIGEHTLVDRVVAYETGDGEPPAPAVAVRRAGDGARIGFDRLLEEHRDAWSERWQDGDVRIEGDDSLQLEVRFALFHLMASVPSQGEAAVGARGLTGDGYRGHVFWDADTFTLPYLAATCPAAARAMLEYRVRRLPAACEIARRIGRAGARFPWESARSGIDVTPRHARDRTGRRVPIRTGLLEEHIVAQVAWAASVYTDWTGDEDFSQGPGLRLLVETARYWQSRVRLDGDDRAHIYGVIGPDEYHETVDDNAFTNVMARWNMRRAADAVEAATQPHDVTVDEIARWRELADAMIDGYDPTTGVYEQFAGFNLLESMLIEEVSPRRPIAADLLLGAERVRSAQVLKQADVLMLYHQIPDELAPDTLEPNLRFYEPRTSHGSSLSPAIHASLFARVGDHDRALDALHIAARMDLDDLTGTTSSGLHLATMGGLWQAIAFGFAGLRPVGYRLVIDPRHPPAWAGLDVRVRFRGSLVRIRTEPSRLTIHADPRAAVLVGDTPYTADANGLRFAWRDPNWEVIR